MESILGVLIVERDTFSTQIHSRKFTFRITEHSQFKVCCVSLGQLSQKVLEVKRPRDRCGNHKHVSVTGRQGYNAY